MDKREKQDNAVAKNNSIYAVMLYHITHSSVVYCFQNVARSLFGHITQNISYSSMNVFRLCPYNLISWVSEMDLPSPPCDFSLIQCKGTMI